MQILGISGKGMGGARPWGQAESRGDGSMEWGRRGHWGQAGASRWWHQELPWVSPAPPPLPTLPFPAFAVNREYL